MPLLAATAFAQWGGNRAGGNDPSAGDRSSTLHGQVFCDNAMTGRLTVELTPSSRGGSFRADIEGDGRFEFRGLAPGEYQLELTGVAGTVIYEEPVVITGGYQNLSIQVPASKNAQGKAGTVSIHQLMHKAPPEAQKEFEKGQSATAKGDPAIALEHFRRAVAIDPEFADAFNGMGSAYAALGQFQEAADQFGKAIDLVPDHPFAVANLSIALCKLARFGEAIQAARRALQLDPGLIKVRFVLGFSLARDGGDQAEALDNLLRAAPEFPQAHLVAAKILIDFGRREEAAEHLEAFLRTPFANESEEDRQKAELWLTQLRQR
jgi:Tfp pilus assembly protein PilF